MPYHRWTQIDQSQSHVVHWLDFYLIKLSNHLMVILVQKVSNEEGGLDFQLSCAMN